jgi:hypothetical protein
MSLGFLAFLATLFTAGVVVWDYSLDWESDIDSEWFWDEMEDSP